MRCGSCGNDAADARFCPGCGRPMPGRGTGAGPDPFAGSMAGRVMAAAMLAASLVLVFLPWAVASLKGGLSAIAESAAMNLVSLAHLALTLFKRGGEGGRLPEDSVFLAATLCLVLFVCWRALYRDLEFVEKAFRGGPEALDFGIRAANGMLQAAAVFIAYVYAVSLYGSPGGGPGFRLDLPVSFKPASAPWTLLVIGGLSRCILEMWTPDDARARP